MNKNKIVYNTQNIHELINCNSDTIYVPSNVIFTPSAMDIIRSKRIKIVYGDENCNCSSNDIADKNNDTAEIVKQTIKILVNKCNITDEKIIKNVIVEVLKRINS
ncbi:hypothetical protein A966_11337 [Brachyspira hampsonii 30446]|uniref:Uncharacterized protein n=1 Tax=Brachyspira hampsonii 30446 TaxID=1289135 RepID=A0A2U4FGJ9_9SPIR|nr:hypothetical protein [Brachyspira hampsonii]EKV56271.1 hypothetical protein A966_11337 [Brachyspira hampsonii 30446]MBW5395634.1 hypothetical protein [Brachyspira hampsonii]OEJ17136.1 hypothetical protein A9495_08100 [Brachyspira hampsonii]